MVEAEEQMNSKINVATVSSSESHEDTDTEESFNKPIVNKYKAEQLLCLAERAVQKQLAGLPMVGNYQELEQVYRKPYFSLVERLRAVIDHLQCSKFATLNYQCFDTRVDTTLQTIEIKYLCELLAYINNADCDRNRVKSYLIELGFEALQDEVKAEKILNQILAYLKALNINKLTQHHFDFLAYNYKCFQYFKSAKVGFTSVELLTNFINYRTKPNYNPREAVVALKKLNFKLSSNGSVAEDVLTRIYNYLATIDVNQLTADCLPLVNYEISMLINKQYATIPVFYLRKRSVPGFVYEDEIAAFIRLVKQKSFNKASVKQTLANNGFYFPANQQAADEIYDNIINYLTKLDLAKIDLAECNANLIDIATSASATQIADFDFKSLLQRKLSYAASVIWGLSYLDFPVPGLTESQALAIERLIADLVDAEITQAYQLPGSSLKKLKLKAELSKFIQKIATGIHDITGGDANNIQQNIVQIERYHTAEFNAGRCYISETKFSRREPNNEQAVIYNDYYVEYSLNNHLTSVQKLEYCRIHNNNSELQPDWFKVLPVYTRDWLRKNIPTAIDGNWSYFESLRLPSSMRNLPGLMNARDCFSFYRYINDNEYQIYSKSTKGTTLTPIGIAENTGRKHVLELNAEQLMQHFIENYYIEFYDFWQINDYTLSYFDKNGKEQIVKPVVFFHSLLSRTFIDKLPQPANFIVSKGYSGLVWLARRLFNIQLPIPDSYMLDAQAEVLRNLSDKSVGDSEYCYKDLCNIIVAEDPANGLRGFARFNDYWEQVDRLFTAATEQLYALGLDDEDKTWDQAWWDKVVSAFDNGKPDFLIKEGMPLAKLSHLTNEQKDNVRLIVFAVKQLRVLRTITPDSANDERNFRLYKSIFQAIVVEALQGMDYSSCQSGKDRAAVDEQYRKAALMRFIQSGRLPGYNDQDDQREAFVKLIKDLTDAKIFAVSAGRNAPGSDGIKERPDQRYPLAVIKAGKIASIAFSGVGIAAGLGLCFVAPLLGIGMICGSAGIGILSACSFNKRPLEKQHRLAILAAFIGVGITIAGVAMAGAAIASGGLALAIGAGFIGCVTAIAGFAAVASLYGAYAKLRRGVSDDDIRLRDKDGHRRSYNISKLNHPEIRKIKRETTCSTAPRFIIEPSASPVRNYLLWKQACPAHLVRNKALACTWYEMDNIFASAQSFNANKSEIINRLRALNAHIGKSKAKDKKHTNRVTNSGTEQRQELAQHIAIFVTYIYKCIWQESCHMKAAEGQNKRKTFKPNLLFQADKPKDIKGIKVGQQISDASAKQRLFTQTVKHYQTIEQNMNKEREMSKKRNINKKIYIKR